MKQIVKGDWVEVVGKGDHKHLRVQGYVLEIAEGELLIKSRFGRKGVYPEDWAKNMDITVTEAGLKDLINLALDIKDKHLFEMYTRDLQALQSK
ncbi:MULTISPECIES: hypothetical protein [Bacillus]|uniref:hypothetical protein n=1 Tax=Bacillus TaxID=1386 RepID=UPI001B67EE8F|nr:MULTISPECIES: hypothetical protein [Bacillus]MCU0155723.1 hypothetical protein [Bacillus safensis]MEC1118507.1 hypothetical protein [Bacillus safensis]UUH73413.1 hypothetical protein NP445_14480 [Bacillus altitudinis]